LVDRAIFWFAAVEFYITPLFLVVDKKSGTTIKESPYAISQYLDLPSRIDKNIEYLYNAKTPF